MSGILYCLPLGESLEETFLEEARQKPYGQCLFLVPNLFYRHRILQSGAALAYSIDLLPREILEHNRPGEPVERIERPAQKKLVENVLAYALQKQLIPYFAPLAEKAGFRDTLLSLFDEFTRDGLEPDTFTDIVAQTDLGEKLKELAALYKLYWALLQSVGRLDLSQLYEKAARVLEQPDTSVPWDTCYFSAYYQFNPVQLHLLETLARHCTVKVALFYDPNLPELSAVTAKLHDQLVGDGFTTETVPARRQLPADLAALSKEWRPGAQCGLQAEHIHFGEGGSPETEIWLALTSIKEKLQAGASPEDFVIILRKLTDYQGLARSFTEFGIPCRLPRVTDLAGQPLVDFLTKLLEAVVEPDDLGRWQALLGCPLMETLYGVKRDQLEQVYTYQYFATAEAYRHYLQRQQLVDSGFWDLVAFVEQPHKAQEWQDTLLERLDGWQLPQTWGKFHQEGKVDLEQVKVITSTVDAVESILEQLVQTWQQSGEANQPVAARELLTFWQETLQKEGTLNLSAGDPRGVRVLEAGEVQGMDFPYVYLLGVREGLFPSVKRESWLLSDQERADLNVRGIGLTVSARDLETDRYFFGSSLALATEGLYISWYRDEEGGPSSYIRELENFYAPDSLPVTVYENRPEGCASAPLLVNLLAEQPKLGTGEEAFLEQAVGTDFRARCATAQKRWESRDNPWNGRVDGLLNRPLHLSASSLDAYLQCPFATLVGRLWQVQPWQEQTAWPDPSVVENLLHQTLATFLGNHLDEKLDADCEKGLQQELETVYGETFEGLLQQGKIFQSPLLPHIRSVYGKWLHTWLHKELGYQQQDGLLPHRVEWAFGRKDSSWPALCREVDGEKVYFSGQIDRIDKAGEKYTVLDYKSGTPPTGGDLARGKVVQLPLYLEALEKLGKVPEEQILGGGYCGLKSGDRTGGLWKPEVGKVLPSMEGKRPKKLEDVETAADQAITKVVQALRNGEFPAAPSGTCPQWCPAKDICRIGENPNLMEQEDD